MTRLISIGGYAFLAVGAAVLVLIGRIVPRRFARFGDLLDIVMRSRSTRIGIVLFWWWMMGWHFLVTRPVG